jgi:hypothetical protein
MRSVILTGVFLTLASGCEVDTVALREPATVAPYRGSGVIDGGASDLVPQVDLLSQVDLLPRADLVPQIDALPASKPDLIPEIDTTPMKVDTLPEVQNVICELPPNAGEFTRPIAKVEIPAGEEISFQVCYGVNAISWSGMSGRTIEINNAPFILGAIDPLNGLILQPDSGGSESAGLPSKPTSIDGHLLFHVSAGPSRALITLSGCAGKCS